MIRAFPCDKGERESNLDQGTSSMCSGSLIKSFVSSDLQFSCKSWYLMGRNRCSDVQNGYETILEHSSNHLVWFWKLRQPQDHSNLGWIDDCTYFPFSCKFKQNKQHPKWPSAKYLCQKNQYYWFMQNIIDAVIHLMKNWYWILSCLLFVCSQCV